jgi:hypothetical protein
MELNMPFILDIMQTTTEEWNICVHLLICKMTHSFKELNSLHEPIYTYGHSDRAVILDLRDHSYVHILFLSADQSS